MAAGAAVTVTVLGAGQPALGNTQSKEHKIINGEYSRVATSGLFSRRLFSRGVCSTSGDGSQDLFLSRVGNEKVLSEDATFSIVRVVTGVSSCSGVVEVPMSKGT